MLSSSTVFKFSIQIASTGPSSTIHVCWFFALAARRHSTAKMPSVQSPVEASRRPNIWGAVMAFGFMRQMTCFCPRSVSAPASTSMMVDLPDPVGPTSMMPWRTWYVSYSCTHLDSHEGCACSPRSFTCLATAASTSSKVALSAFTPGNRSSMRDRKRGTSSATNLDMFMSRSVRITRYVSLFSGLARLEEPMVRSTDRMLRSPKS